MHSTLIAWLSAFSVSAISARYWSFLPDKPWLALSACILIIVHTAQYVTSLCTHDKKRDKEKGIADWYGKTRIPFTVVPVIFSGMMSGTIWMASVGHWYSAWQLPHGKIQQDVIVLGRITQARLAGAEQRLVVRVDKLDGERLIFSPSVYLRINETIGRFSLHQQVQFEVRLKPVSTQLNPGADRRAWFVSQGIIATGHVAPSAHNRVIEPATSFHHYSAGRVRRAGYSRWLVALLCGDRRDFTTEDWQLMQVTGTGHLFSISGLHVGMVALWSGVSGMAMIGLLLIVSGRCHNRYAVRACVVLLSLCMTAIYATLANWQVPVFRAWLLVLLCCWLFFSKTYWLWQQRFIVMIAACIMVFPLSVYGSSFYLSAGALGLLLVLASRFRNEKTCVSSRLRQVVLIQCALSFLLMPVTTTFFNTISLFTAPVNLIAIPLITLIVPVGMLGVIINYIQLQPNLLLDSAEYGLSLIILFLTAIQPWMVVQNNVVVSAFASLLLLVVLLMGLLPPFRFKKRIMMILIVPFAGSYLNVSSKPWMIHVFDVGQGTAVVISRGERGVLIDTGPSYETSNALTKVVVPALNSLGIRAIDRVLLSHGDDDHAGGKPSIELLPLQSRFTQTPFVLTNTAGCQRGQHWQWQQLTFAVLWPAPGNQVDTNLYSCVVRVSDGEHAVLITGDIDKSTEYAMLYLNAGQLRADILFAPHHGSKTSSSMAFISAVSPRFTVFTTGAFHRWQLPHADVVHRYEYTKADLFDTGDHGYLRFTVSDYGILTETYNRDISPRWYDNRDATHY